MTDFEIIRHSQETCSKFFIDQQKIVNNFISSVYDQIESKEMLQILQQAEETEHKLEDLRKNTIKELEKYFKKEN